MEFISKKMCCLILCSRIKFCIIEQRFSNFVPRSPGGPQHECRVLQRLCWWFQLGHNIRDRNSSKSRSLVKFKKKEFWRRRWEDIVYEKKVNITLQVWQYLSVNGYYTTHLKKNKISMHNIFWGIIKRGIETIKTKKTHWN